MTDNKKLIEEAAKAIQALGFPDHGIGWDESTEYGREHYRESARAALAVFEKAHTPTDDEREALHELLGPILHLPISAIRDRILVRFGFRRTEVPEPSAERQLTPCGYLVCTGCRVCGCAALGIEPQGEPSSEVPEPSVEDYPDAEGLVALRSNGSEPHGEPSDAQNWNCGKCDREEALGRDDGQIPSHHRSCQADVKLLAAANAYMRYQPPYDDLSAFSPQFRADMRAALRAAGGVR